MPRSNSFQSYGSVAKTFHWLTALLIIAVIPLGGVANDLAHQIRSPGFAGTQADIARATLLFSLHKTVGVAIFLTALARILWALTQPKPGLLNANNRPEALAAETVHWLLYSSLLLVPLSGWIHHAATPGFAPIWWPFGQSLPFVPQSERVSEFFAGLHHVLIRLLFVALFLHVGGALKHHFVDRDHTLKRMLPGTSAPPEPPAQAHGAAPVFVAVVIWGCTLAIGGMLGAFGHSHTAQEQAEAETTSVSATRDTPSETGNWVVQQGTLGLAIQQMGSTVKGRFDDWTATISYEDPQSSGPAGSVDVQVDITSLSLGTVSNQAMGPDFFDAGRFPTAKFTARLDKTETGHAAVGTLTIRDKAVPVTMPFDLTIDDNQANMHGTLTLKRTDFDIGATVTDPASLGFEVEVEVTLTATRGS
jgi:cytochrome b561/polyisoprenoid-binding protein YceI